MSYQETLQYLYDRLPVFHHIGSSAYKPGLDNTIRLMNSLNNPQKRFRSIHIAGTNGKGSVSHFLAAILQSAGYKVGLYTSPHLVHFGERIRIDGQMIEEQYVIDFVENNKELFEAVQPSFFEATMAMAFNYFADRQVDVAIIEVGLGGRLDSTNIIEPELSVITNISFDHTGFLGNTLEKIAFEKAGIIKQNTPVVIGETLPETRLVFEKKVREMNAPLVYAENKYHVHFDGYEYGKMKVKANDGRSFVVGLSGLYQLKNIATVLAAADKINKGHFKLSNQNISKGLECVTEITGLQGRWQVLQENPKIVADTGHNVAGIGCVVDQLKSETFKILHFVIGMVNDKDISSVLSLLPKNAVYYFTQANIFRALSADELCTQARIYGLNGDAYKTVEQAVNAAISKSKKDDFVLIGGSNFIVGEALPMFEKSVANKTFLE
jgi:dihydrofolate synthase / folylpolyglutamate synthase